MSSVKESDIEKGQAVYTPIMLKLYNLWVLDISNLFIWRCSKAKQLAQFNKYTSSNHLDIGVGTGYYLKSSKMPPQPKVSLMDLNLNCLKAAKEALLKNEIDATIYQADIFKKQPALTEKFSSISMILCMGYIVIGYHDLARSWGIYPVFFVIIILIMELRKQN